MEKKEKKKGRAVYKGVFNTHVVVKGDYGTLVVLKKGRNQITSSSMVLMFKVKTKRKKLSGKENAQPSPAERLKKILTVLYTQVMVECDIDRKKLLTECQRPSI